MRRRAGAGRARRSGSGTPPCRAASATRPMGWNKANRACGRAMRANSRRPAIGSARWCSNPAANSASHDAARQRQAGGVGPDQATRARCDAVGGHGEHLRREVEAEHRSARADGVAQEGQRPARPAADVDRDPTGGRGELSDGARITRARRPGNAGPRWRRGSRRSRHPHPNQIRSSGRDERSGGDASRRAAAMSSTDRARASPAGRGPRRCRGPRRR